MWEVVEYAYLYTLLKYKTIPMCKDTQNNLKYEEKHDIFSTKLAYSIIKVENEIKSGRTFKASSVDDLLG